MEGGQPFGAHATSKGSVIPRLCKAGWLRIRKNAPVPLKAQTGWLVISRSLLIDAREALLIEGFQSVRCANIYKDASQYYATTPSARILGILDARSHPALQRWGIGFASIGSSTGMLRPVIHGNRLPFDLFIHGE